MVPADRAQAPLPQHPERIKAPHVGRDLAEQHSTHARHLSASRTMPLTCDPTAIAAPASIMGRDSQIGSIGKRMIERTFD